MPSYSFTLTALGGLFADEKQMLQRLEPLYLQAIRDVVDPELARAYDATGLQSGGPGKVKQAISQQGAAGRIDRIEGNRITVTVDFDAVPGAWFALMGNTANRADGLIHPTVAKALHFTKNGQSIFTKHVRPSPPHDVYGAVPSDIGDRFAARVMELLTEGGV